jgi:2-polyprenyl-3-methyl-5-hydroxy-6-metoxy-1,4-benzoquinol methylase
MNLRESLKEIAEYLKIDFDVILENYSGVKEKYPGFVKWSNLSAEEWNEKHIDQKNINDVMEFYRKTPNYIFELMEYHSTESKQELSNTVIRLAKEANARTIIDFGAGICQDSIIASMNELKATAADIPGKTFDFGQWRIGKYKVPIKIIEICDETPLKEQYDAITCFEVLQHVVNPAKTLMHLREHLSQEGRLFITTRFRNNYSLALEHNEYLDESFEQLIEDCELNVETKRHMWGKDDKIKYLYVLKHKS